MYVEACTLTVGNAIRQKESMASKVKVYRRVGMEFDSSPSDEAITERSFRGLFTVLKQNLHKHFRAVKSSGIYWPGRLSHLARKPRTVAVRIRRLIRTFQLDLGFRLQFE